MAEETRRIKTPIGRLNWPNLFDPRQIKQDDGTIKTQFDLVLIFASTTDLGELRKLVNEVAGAKWPAKIPANLDHPLRTNEDKAAEGDDGYEDAAGFHINAKCDKGRPGVCRPDGKEYTSDDGSVYAGCYGLVLLSAYAWSHKGKNGVSFKLIGFQKTGDGKPISTSSYVPGSFEPVTETVAESTGGDVGGDLFS